MPTVDAVNMTPPTPLPQCTGSGVARQDTGASEVTVNWLSSAGTCKGAYVHVPFCFHKCHYCDFFSVVGQEGLQGDYLHAIEKELAAVGPHCRPIESIFIGGGTPTLLEAPLLARLLEGIQQHIPMEIGAEWTVEANPETIDQDIAEVLRCGGVNRVSIGAQSFDQNCLDALDRRHDPEKVASAVERLRVAGISSINLDIIFAIPDQTLDMVRRDLDAVIAINPEHVSCYGLTYEPGTPLHRRRAQGQVRSVSQDRERDMFTLVMDRLGSAGFEHYEISNFARSGHACRHNLLYWTNGNWWPFGPSAAGHVSGRRWRNIPRLADYLTADPMPPIDQLETTSEDVAAGESFMMRLRLRRGMPRTRVETLLGCVGGEKRAKAIELHREAGLLEWRDDYLRLTEDGLYLADTVIGDLLCTGTATMADT
jgi:oxygen-independent coproporphyrinogen-3 oxidase